MTIPAANSISNEENSLFIEDKNLKTEISALKLRLTLRRSSQNANYIVSKITNDKYQVFKRNNKYILNKSEFTLFLSNLSDIEENLTQIKKVKKNIWSVSKKKFKKNNIKRFFKNSSEYYQDVVKTLIQSEKIDDLPSKLSRLKVFKPYHSFITILLQKGSSKSLICDLGKSNRLKKYYFNSREFNSIFNSIKKSKSQYFYEHKTISKSLKLVGCFLAKTFTLKTHNLIVIISKDDFIPPSQNESTAFTDFSMAIEKALKFIELKNIIFTDLHIYLSTLYQLDYYIALYDQNQLIAGNSDNTTFDKSFSPTWSELQIQYTNPSKIFTSTDLFHYQRIKLLGELFNILKHELSNPIFGMKMSLDLLIKDSLQENPREILEQIQNSANRSLEILNNMTDIFTNEKSHTVKTLGESLNKVYTLCKSELKLIQFEVFHDSPEIENLSIKTNITFLSQILFNLFINATQELKKTHSNPRDRKIKVSTKKDGDFINISVTDNGRGILKEEQQKVFQLFYSKKKTGNGIGLPLSKALAKKLGGDLLLINSSPGQTTFSLEVPIKADQI